MKSAHKARIKCDFYTAILWLKKHFSFSRKTEGPRAFLFSCPDHGNAGDIAIEEAEKGLLKEHFSELTTINTRDLLKQSSIAKDICSKDVLFLQGGGSFGGLYDQSDIERLALFRVFKHNKIISFPQSICFTDELYKKMYCHILKKRNNVYLFFREKMSYDLAVKSFPFMKERIFLTPDIVMLLDRRNWATKYNREFVTLTFRDDKEKIISNEESKKMIDVIKRNNRKISILNKDTYEEINYKLELKQSVLKDVLDKYSKSKLVITDRLHGMILAYITNTPCIAISNNNGKVKSMYETWLKDCNFISFFDNLDVDQIASEAKKLLRITPKGDVAKRSIDAAFEKLREVIKN